MSTIPEKTAVEGDERVSQPDAANDGHSGYTIYTRLIARAGVMVNPPTEGCYSFNVDEGSLCDPHGRAWHPGNPDYDPGPPPQPKPPKEKKEQKKKGARAERDNGTLQNSEVSRQPKQHAHGRQHYQHYGERSGYGSNRQVDTNPGQSYGRMNGLSQPAWDRTGANMGRGHTRSGPARQQHGRGRGGGGGRGIGGYNKCVRRILHTLGRL